MRGKLIKLWLLPLLMAAGVSACASNGVQPGIVNTSSGGSQTASAQSTVIGSGRVVSVNEVNLAGSGGGGSGSGPLIGGLLGGIGGAAIGATRGTIGGGIVGGVLGAVGGAIAGAILDNHGGSMSGGRGIEVTVQKDDGQTVRIAQRDDGDIQLGDRVQILQARNGVARAVHDNSRRPDDVLPPSQDPYQSGPSQGGPYQGDPYQAGGPYPTQRYQDRSYQGPPSQDMTRTSQDAPQGRYFGPPGYDQPTRNLE